MMSAAATDIIVEIMNKIIDNVDKTVDANKKNVWKSDKSWEPGKILKI